MKCPKCQYLRFESGDRCKNCGYDFSLVEFRSTLERQIEFARPSEPAHETSQDSWDRFDSAPGAPLEIDVPLYADTAPSGVVDAVTEPPLPRFALTAEDQPLVRLPAAPRRPLAVRRTPEHPRLRPPVRDFVVSEAPADAEGHPAFVNAVIPVREVGVQLGRETTT